MSLRHKTMGRARELRAEQTSAEDVLWAELRDKRLGNLKFRRQHPVPPFILDFSCRKLKLAVEVDGATHGSDEERAKDAARTSFLEHEGWTVIRFWNGEVYDHLDDVLEAIWRKAEDLKC